MPDYNEDQVRALKFVDTVLSKVQMCMCGPDAYIDAVDKALATGLTREQIDKAVSHR